MALENHCVWSQQEEFVGLESEWSGRSHDGAAWEGGTWLTQTVRVCACSGCGLYGTGGRRAAGEFFDLSHNIFFSVIPFSTILCAVPQSSVLSHNPPCSPTFLFSLPEFSFLSQNAPFSPQIPYFSQGSLFSLAVLNGISVAGVTLMLRWWP